MQTIRGFRDGDADWVRKVHLRHYAEAEGFDASFAAAVDAALDGFRRDRDTGAAEALIAEADGGRIGCLFLGREDARTLRLRLFLVVAAHRGTGLGRRLLGKALTRARDAGVARVAVATFDSHAAAGRLYARAGLRIDSAGPVRRFGRNLVEQHWEIDPRPTGSPCIDDSADVDPNPMPP